MTRLIVGLSALGAPLSLMGQTQAIADNSFLIEEAYNQEPGVVQHISVFQLFRGGDSWAYSFTQEWPLFGRQHQLSYTVPVERTHIGSSVTTGLGDVAVNYRYQLVGGGADRLSIAPRLSVLLPTGSSESGLGAGALGVQTNLPVSVVVANRLVTHWNAGATLARSSKSAYTVGASGVWLVRPTFNLLLEAVWTTSGTSSDDVTVSPGIRWARDFSSGLQIVPGIAFPLAVGSIAGRDAVILYLSFEHPFRRIEH